MSPQHLLSFVFAQFAGGAAGGPSGMTADHIFPLLESEHDSQFFCQAASALACGEIPEEILSGFRLGRLIALRKPDGGVRGIVVGEILRRLIARSIAKQMAKSVEAATAPFQYALSTKAGCECVAHILQTLTDLDGKATVLSIDGIGTNDVISRSTMLVGLLNTDRRDGILPLVWCFHGSPSTHLWEDEVGMSHEIAQGEGRGARGSFEAHAVRIGIAPSSQSSPQQDASGRENFRGPRRCFRDLQTRTGSGGFQDP